MPDPVEGRSLSDRCVAALVPQAAIDAAVKTASKPLHDDGHTDCYYAGILLAAWPYLRDVNAVEVDRLRAENERLKATLLAIGPDFPMHHIDSEKGGRWVEYDDGDGFWDDGDVHTDDCPACALSRRIDEALGRPVASDEQDLTEGETDG